MIATQTDVEKLVRWDIAGMKPYVPILPFEVVSEQLGRPIEDIIKLDANENPYGSSPKAIAALAALADTAPIYPDPEARRLRAMLAEYVGVSADHILVGAGADELIDLIIRLLIDAGDTVIDCPPTFGMYSFDTAQAGGSVINVMRRPDFSLDIEAIERAVIESNAKLLFVGSPNNPDGSLLPVADLDRLLALPLVVVLDEAYIEFSGAQQAESAAKRVPDAPNLIVLRTFSKWAGLAGLRVGYGIFPLGLISHLWKIKQPYNLNVAADAAARASLDDLPALQANIKKIVAERGRMGEALSEISYLRPFPSQSNFVLCQVTGLDAASIKKQLAEDAGILIRYFDKPGLRDHIRISAGKPEHTDALIAALKKIGATNGR